MGALAGGELLHLAAAVVLGGLCSETLLILFLLPVACHKLAPAPRPSPTAQPPELALPVPSS